jgi:2,4-dienoyl-CoA reductase-like NADH-dependent reductase (Old Yellow Enzyme family)
MGPLGQAQFDRGEHPWPVVSASDSPCVDGWLKPTALTREIMDDVKEAFVAAARRALVAGFDVVEVHCAHGFLLNSFLSPITNKRTDEFGSDIEGRMRFTLEVIQAVRDVWPDDRPLFVRVSAVDGLRAGLSIDDTVVFAQRLKALGIDVVDCSSGGIAPRYENPSSYGYQVPYASRVRAETGIGTMAVGLIVDGHQAEAVVANEHADIVAIGREALVDFWREPNADAEPLSLLPSRRDGVPLKRSKGKPYAWCMRTRPPGPRSLDAEARVHLIERRGLPVSS